MSSDSPVTPSQEPNAHEPNAPKPGEARLTRAPHGPSTRYAAMTLGVLGILAVGIVAGAGAVSLTRPSPEMAPTTPVAIASMPTTGLVTVKGQVAEIYGNKFVLQDSSGRALVETGRAGEGGKLVAKDEPVTVQGRFDDGFLRASFVVHADGRAEAIGPVGPPPPPHGGPRAWFKP